MDARSKRGRERQRSPDRSKVSIQPRINGFKKVQVVYYLSRNGQLEHPHYVEITLFANQHLRLKDVLDRLTVLRGKGMPSLYSWSCKRSYKNGYVWNDLAENDIIYTSDGTECILKGSELVDGCSERLQKLQVSSGRHMVVPDLNLHERRKHAASQPRQLDSLNNTKHVYQEYDEEESQEDFEEEEKTTDTSSTTPHSRCSRGVSTDELEDPPAKNPAPQPTQKPQQASSISKRHDRGDPAGSELVPPGRSSVLLQLISCGNLAVAKAPRLKRTEKSSSLVKKSEGDHFHKSAANNNAAARIVEEDEVCWLSENPRFGNLHVEDKEYFSGSIVEEMNKNRGGHEIELKRSNSYHEPRAPGVGAGDEERQGTREIAATTRCIPRKKLSSLSMQAKK